MLYGEAVFTCAVLETVADKRDLATREQWYIDTLAPEYNMLRIAYSGVGVPQSAETRAKRAESVRRALANPEVRERISKANRGRKRTMEQRARMGVARRGIPLSVTTREKLSRALTGRVVTPDARAKIGAANRGKVVSAETRAKLAALATGRTHTAESRAKMSQDRKGKVLHPNTSAAISHMNRARSAEDWQRISAKAVTTKRERYGHLPPHTHTAEAREKIAAAKQAYWQRKREAMPISSASENDAVLPT